MAKVSVIVPIYNAQKYIRRCVTSLFEQTLDDIEYIFIDDCTPDDSIGILLSIINEYPHRRSQIRIERMTTNCGQAAVRKYAIGLATGKYIIHCDSDDWVEKTMFAKLYEKAIKESLDIVICDFYITDGINSERFNCESICDKYHILSDFISQKVAVSLWNKLIKSDLYKKNKITYPKHNMGEDYAILCQIAYYAKSYGYVDTPLYYYYNVNPESISNKKSYKDLENIWIGLHYNIQIVVNFFNKTNLTNKFKRDFDILKNKYRNELIKFIPNNNLCRSLWLSTYPNTNFFSEIGIKNKIRYIFIYLGIYTYIKKKK